uniref:Putative secreted protein n=1 Tax=Hemileia vastatrix TaxID=203904 RepID=T1UNX3_9BASI|nr:putative secreted protein [Hemileia vastatrix]
MHFKLVFFSIALSFSLAIAQDAITPPKHTQCYHHFLKKDGCVHAAKNPQRRCDPKTGKPLAYETKGAVKPISSHQVVSQKNTLKDV